MVKPLPRPHRPESRVARVEDLVARILRGEVRIPGPQWPLRWDGSEVAALFDSLYQGFPIGSLLLVERPAEAERLKLGPLTIQAAELPDAWWVLEGRQRLVSLVAGFRHPLSDRPSASDPFAIYFDAENLAFHLASDSGSIPDSWVPLPVLWDVSSLERKPIVDHIVPNETLLGVVRDAGTRICRYPIPFHLIEAEQDEDAARTMFIRLRGGGHSSDWPSSDWQGLREAIFADPPSSPSTLDELAEALEKVGMGRLGSDQLLSCLAALLDEAGLDGEATPDPAALPKLAPRALPALRRSLSFLAREAGLVHRRLWPDEVPLEILTRFFHLHPNPHSRVRILLVRWLWRILLGAGKSSEQVLRQKGLRVIDSDAEESMQQLLTLVHKERPQQPPGDEIRILALASLGPRRLDNGEPLDLVELLGTSDRLPLRPIVNAAESSLADDLANRLFQPEGVDLVEALNARMGSTGSEDRVLQSHGIDEDAVEAWNEGDRHGFLRHRAELLDRKASELGEQKAAWDHNDRPSIDYILARAGVEPPDSPRDREEAHPGSVFERGLVVSVRYESS